MKLNRYIIFHLRLQLAQTRSKLTEVQDLNRRLQHRILDLMEEADRARGSPENISSGSSKNDRTTTVSHDDRRSRESKQDHENKKSSKKEEHHSKKSSKKDHYGQTSSGTYEKPQIIIL